MSESSIEITTYKSLVEFQDLQPLHCQKDALTDFFGNTLVYFETSREIN